MANKASSEAEALHIGIIAEKDSILFYSEMRNLVRESDRHIIDAIVGEEKAHLRQLSQLKAKLQKTWIKNQIKEVKMGVKKVGEKYRCNICGNEVTVTKVGGGTLVCCGQDMELISS